mgnify:CR=1 FL=1
MFAGSFCVEEESLSTFKTFAEGDHIISFAVRIKEQSWINDNDGNQTTLSVGFQFISISTNETSHTVDFDTIVDVINT